MQKKHSVSLLIVAVFTVLGLLLSSGGPVFAQASIRIEGNLMSADIADTPLRDVLSEISRQTGITVQIEEGLQGAVSKRISNLSLEEGLKRILSDYSYTMIYAENERGEIVPKEVKVFKKGNAAPIFERLKTPAVPTREAPPAQEDEGGSKEEAPVKEEPAEEAPSREEAPPREEGEGEGGEAAPPKEAPENTSSSLQKKQARADMMRIRQEIAELRQSLRDNQNADEGASIRSEISRKTVELQQREAWLKARTQGLERMERQQAGR